MSATGSLLRGLKWRVEINGRNSINGARYSIDADGETGEISDHATIYDLMHKLADHIKAKNLKMELPDSFRVTLYPPSQKDE